MGQQTMLNPPGLFETRERGGTTWRAAGAAAMMPEAEAAKLVERFERDHPKSRGRAIAAYRHGAANITISRTASYDKPTMTLTQKREVQPC